MCMVFFREILMIKKVAFEKPFLAGRILKLSLHFIFINFWKDLEGTKVFLDIEGFNGSISFYKCK